MRILRRGIQAGAGMRVARPTHIALSERNLRAVYVLSDDGGELPILDVGQIGGEMEPLEVRQAVRRDNGVLVVSVDGHPDIREVILYDSGFGPSFVLDCELSPTMLVLCNVLDFTFSCDRTGCRNVLHVPARFARRELAGIKAEADGLRNSFEGKRLGPDPLELLGIDLAPALECVLQAVASEPDGHNDTVLVPRTFVTSLERLRQTYDELRSEGPGQRGGLVYVLRFHLLLRGLLASAGIQVEPLYPHSGRY